MTNEPPGPAEPHYTVAELARVWRVGTSTIYRWFMDEPGVLKFGGGSANPRKKRRYVSLRIPRHVAERVYRRLAG